MLPDVARVSPRVSAAFLISDEPCVAAPQPLPLPGRLMVMRIAADVCLRLSQPANCAGGFHELLTLLR